MKLIYKDYLNPTIYLRESGYLCQLTEHDEKYVYSKLKENYDNIEYIPGKYNNPYFSEANTVIEINLNEDNYFDFSKNMIDIGANVGCYTITTYFKHTYCFEPNDYLYHMLCVNLMIHNKYECTTVYNDLLSNKVENIKYDGFQTFLTDQPNVFYNENINDEDFTRKSNIIKSHTLDEYNCEKVGFIKIDVEGMEENVLRGGIGTIIRNNYPPILFELWDVNVFGMTQEKHDSLQNFLENLGYEIKWYWGDEETHLAIHK